MQKSYQQAILTSFLSSCFGALMAQPCTIQTPPLKFPWPLTLCPTYSEIAKSQWIPKALEEYQTGLTFSKAEVIPIVKMANCEIKLLKYIYKFNIEGYRSQHEFYYLVETPKNLTLWECRTLEYPSGSLESIRHRTVAGRNILELEFFTGGTAGYWEEYFEVGESQLLKINESYVSESKLIIPKGYGIRRVQANVENLTATIYLAKSDDANCCPSGRLELKLTLLDHSLHLKDGHFLENK